MYKHVCGLHCSPILETVYQHYNVIIIPSICVYEVLDPPVEGSAGNVKLCAIALNCLNCLAHADLHAIGYLHKKIHLRSECKPAPERKAFCNAAPASWTDSTLLVQRIPGFH